MTTLMRIAVGFASNFTLNSMKTACTKVLLEANPPQQNQVRTRYVNWRMWRDVKRRRMVKEYDPLRTRLNAIRKNTILPKELQEIADEEIAALPKDSARTRLQNRCVITSRSKGNLQRWRICRMQLRSLMDYNKMSGIIRAKW